MAPWNDVDAFDHFLYRREDQKHSVLYELGWRTVTDPSRHASRAVQQQFGHTLKSGVVYTFRHSHWPTGRIADGGGALRCSAFGSVSRTVLSPSCAYVRTADIRRGLVASRGDFLTNATSPGRTTSELAGLGIGNSVLQFAKQRLQGDGTIPLPDTTAYFSFGKSATEHDWLGRHSLMVPDLPRWPRNPKSGRE